MMIFQSVQQSAILQDLPHIIIAVGGLGTAAFGMVDAVKPLGVNHIGFTRIANGVKALTAESRGPAGLAANSLPQRQVVASLKANWYNGTDLGSQKSIAKSLVKMGLNQSNSDNLAKATGVDPTLLKSVASKIASGTKLEADESDVFARFDFSLTAVLDELYQHGDQVYRNWTRILAALFALGLALFGGWSLCNAGKTGFWGTNDMWLSLLAGLLATPLAPIAKDLSSALSTAVNTMQAIKR
ncbi:MAG: hypothetical protein ABR923_08310 [Terracidiphilus sp.]|jgi:hypothetical protein